MDNYSVTWFGHGTLRLETKEGKKLFIDPWLAGNPAVPDALRGDTMCDAILLTHGHFDHVGETTSIIEETDCSIVSIFELGSYLSWQGVPESSIIQMNKGGAVEIAGCKATMTHALHTAGVLDRHDAQPEIDVQPAHDVIDVPVNERRLEGVVEAIVAPARADLGEQAVERTLEVPDLGVRALEGVDAGTEVDVRQHDVDPLAVELGGIGVVVVDEAGIAVAGAGG